MYNELLKRSEELAKEMAKDFKEVIKREWPEDDTAPHSKDEWVVNDNIVENKANYSAILWTGRYYSPSANRWLGSKQMPDGGDPILRDFLRNYKGYHG